VHDEAVVDPNHASNIARFRSGHAVWFLYHSIISRYGFFAIETKIPRKQGRGSQIRTTDNTLTSSASAATTR
jgi:hypothetical protein